MTEEQILQMVKEYFIEGEIDEDGYCWTDFSGTPDAFVKFAQEIYRKAYSIGHRDGYNDGWEGSKVSTEMNTWSSDDDL